MGLELSYSNGSRLVVLAFDGTIREMHNGALTIPTHPVRKGANIADHARKQLALLTGEVFVTNHPIKEPATGMNGVRGSVRGLDLALIATEETRQQRTVTYPTKFDMPIGVPIVGSLLGASGALNMNETVTVQTRTTVEAPDGATAQVLQFDAPFDRVRATFEELEGLQTGVVILTATTSLKEYTNLVLENLTISREFKDGSGGTFTFNLREVRFAETQTVKVPIDKKKATAKMNQGAKPTEKIEDRSFAVGAGQAIQKRFNLNFGIRQ